MIDALVALGVFVAAFLLGSIPWGLIISKVFYHTDIREHGSGNIGTTNAMRTMGKKGGAAVFLLDFGKGIASGFIGMGATSFLTGSFVSYETLLGIATMGCTLGAYFQPVAGLSRRQGHRCGHWRIVRVLGACGGMHRAVRHFCRARRAYALCFGGFHRIRGAVPGYRMLPVLGRLGRYCVLFRHGHDGCVGPSWQH